MNKKTFLLKTQKPNIEAIKNGVNFDKDTYEKNIYEAIIENKAKETEERLTKERDMIRSWIFEIERDNLKLDTKRKEWEIDWEDELLKHFESLVSEWQKFYKKLHPVVEEMVKNVKKNKYYGNDWENEKNKQYEEGRVKIIGDTNKITVTTTNYTKDNISRIPKRLDELNNMDEETLKKTYINRMTNWEISERWGAGLWFMEILRKSNGGKFTYSIENTENPEIKKLEISISLLKKSLQKKKLSHNQPKK